ncbi:MAG: DNA-directed RNA polymerase subunit alpha [Chloroflexi bacterium ADurb.Bin325]|nr:MAG: DNA-directed RNA polymerase subunit alpha [Chloroflexi bacterium ADurb.Bin325]
MLNFVLPKIERETSARNYGRFVIGPMESGYGITLGNALRRVLLSSLPGAAVTSVRLSGVHHEFSPIPNVREDTTALLLNIKQLRLKSETEEPVRLHVDVRSEGPVTAGDLIGPPEVEIINPELLLLTADAPEVDLDLELTVNRGRGYSPAEERGKLPLGEIPVDAIYTPVRKVNYTVSRARIGQQTNYDRLALEIWTDGTMTPEAALQESARLLVSHLTLIAGADVLPVEHAAGEGHAVPSRIFDVPIEDLELSVRAYNCLKRAGITKVGEVLEKLEKGEDEILAIRNFGRKSLSELVQRLDLKGYLSAIAYEPTGVGEVDGEGELDEEL